MSDFFLEIKNVLPLNVLRYVEENDGTSIAININSASADYGYAHVIHKSVVISRLTRTCHHCGYDPLWKPDDSESKCRRHIYSTFRYDTVFTWTPNQCDLSLKDAFDQFLKAQPQKYGSPCIRKDFGKIGW